MEDGLGGELDLESFIFSPVKEDGALQADAAPAKSGNSDAADPFVSRSTSPESDSLGCSSAHTDMLDNTAAELMGSGTMFRKPEGEFELDDALLGAAGLSMGWDSMPAANSLKLNYTEVMGCWQQQGGGDLQLQGAEQPNFKLDMDTSRSLVMPASLGELHGKPTTVLDEKELDRRMRVERYRRKRRERAFVKKIRYEVRKLNAEQRPRFKGRFIKQKDLVAMQAAEREVAPPPPTRHTRHSRYER